MTATVNTLAFELLGAVGTVTFTDTYTIGGVTTNTTLGTVTLPAVVPGVTAVQATFTTSTLAQANHTLRAIYNGDNTAPFPLPTAFPFRQEWVTSASAPFALPVTADTTTGTLSANPTNNSPFGSAVTFIDRLTSGNGGTVHGGTVVFKDGTTVIGTTSVNIRGTASLVITSLNVPGSPHSVTAFYNGSGNFKASTSNTVAYTIVPGASTTTITGPNTASSTTVLTVTSLTRAGTTATATVSGPVLTSNIMTIAGATPTGYNGIFDVTLTGPHTFTYAVPATLTTPATGTITATEFLATSITVGQAFNVTGSVVGAAGFTPTGSLVFVAESNRRDAAAAHRTIPIVQLTERARNA
jgi:hypothetical protein